MLSRRKFIKSTALIGASFPLIGPFQLFERGENDFTFQSLFMGVKLNNDRPSVKSLWLDSIGKGMASANPILGMTSKSEKKGNFECKHILGNKVSYRLKNQSEETKEAWHLNFGMKSISISSNYINANESFEILIDQKINHATVLGMMNERNKVTLPCLIHFPGMGTLRVTCDVKETELLVDARRVTGVNNIAGGNNGVTQNFIKVLFPPATEKFPEITYNLEVVAIHPLNTNFENNPHYEGFRRNFINIFQINPRLRVLANNSSSDPCAFTLYQQAMLAQFTPSLAPGLAANDLIRISLDRYLSGMKAYGLVGYVLNYENADTTQWYSKYDSSDSYPSLLLAACYYIQSSNDLEWGRKNLKGLLNWAEVILSHDTDNDGLIEYPLSGNYGSWITTVHVDNPRPANWWDTIGFAHKDAYSNAIAYKALLFFSDILKKMNNNQSRKYYNHARKIKSVYYSTFYNKETGVLAGWKSEDGQLHDYYFTFVNGIAITFGLIEKDNGKAIMNNMLAKMKKVGYTNFSLGLPGNLIPIKKGDYTHLEHRWGGPSLEDGSDAFQIYENGGATACYTYFTIKALQICGMKEEADLVLVPMLKSFKNGDFEGRCSDTKMTKDWKTWTGECWGYEGFLVDSYLTLLAVVDEKS